MESFGVLLVVVVTSGLLKSWMNFGQHYFDRQFRSAEIIRELERCTVSSHSQPLFNYQLTLAGFAHCPQCVVHNVNTTLTLTPRLITTRPYKKKLSQSQKRFPFSSLAQYVYVSNPVSFRLINESSDLTLNAITERLRNTSGKPNLSFPL